MRLHFQICADKYVTAQHGKQYCLVGKYIFGIETKEKKLILRPENYLSLFLIMII